MTTSEARHPAGRERGIDGDARLRAFSLRAGRVVGCAVMLALSAAGAGAATYYVDASCSVNGNGLVDSCAAAAGQAGRFNDLHSCDTAMVAGDTCLIRPGAYYRNISAEGGRRDLNTGFRPSRSGTASAPITYRAFDPNNRPQICSAPGCSTSECNFTNSAIGPQGQSYIVYDGLRVIGNVTIWGYPGRSSYVTLTNTEISGGFTWPNQACGGSDFDGNWSGLRIETAGNLTIQNVYIHDVMRGGSDRGNGIKMFDVDDSTFDHVTVYNTLYSGLELKADCTNDTFRYGKLINVAQQAGESAIRGANQTPPNGGHQIHHNVIVCGASDSETSGYYIPTPHETGVDQFHHNTVYKCAQGVNLGDGASGTHIVIHDNIIEMTSASAIYNTVTARWSSPCEGCVYDGLNNNAYRYAGWRWNTTSDGAHNYSDLASWQAFWDGLGHATFESASRVADCQFVNPSKAVSADFHVQNATCKSMSSTGGYVGAYDTDAACLGYGCSGVGSNQSPESVIDAPAGDVTIEVGGSVTFAGTGSDPDGNLPLSYHWTFGAGSGVPDSTAEDPGSKTYGTAGAYTATFTVTDSLGASDTTPATRTITVTVPGQSGPLPKSGWQLKYVDSQETQAENGAAVNSFDSSASTIWHTQWYSAQPPCPHEIQIDLGTTYSIDGFRYLPRQDGDSNGNIGQYEFYVSPDGVSWGSARATGTFANNAIEKEVRFTASTGRFVRLRALTAANGGPYASMAELGVLGTVPGAGHEPSSVTGLHRDDVRP